MKMKSKKSKSKKKNKSETKKSDKEQLSEVDKTFFELQIADLNRKLERVTKVSIELEERNDNLTTSNQQLDEDRADIIAYLKKTVQEQGDQIIDLIGRLEALKVTGESEKQEFEERLLAKDNAFEQMQTQLKSEIGLLEGKLNVLEEFRLQREELLKKFEVQEAKQQQQEAEHKEALYTLERKVIVDKDTLRRHVEMKLVELANEFQNVTDLRITETTQRLIRENIAVNNENILLVQEQKELYRERDELVAKCRGGRLKMELAQNEATTTLKKCNVQKKIIQEMATKYEEIQNELKGYQTLKGQLEEKENAILSLKASKEDLQKEFKLLKDNLKDCQKQRKLLIYELTNNNEKVAFLTKTLFEAIFNIRSMINPNKTEEIYEEEEQILEERDSILKQLYTMFLNAKEAERECKDLETWVKFYQTGCAGFVPKLRSLDDIKQKNTETQVGVSFQEFLQLQDCNSKTRNKSKSKASLSSSDKTTIDTDFSDS